MDVSSWAPEKIMQLPDCCFGERQTLCCYVSSSGAVPVWDISEIAILDVCVLWDLMIWQAYCNNNQNYIRIAWGHFLPKSTAEMDQLQPVLSGFGAHGFEPRKIPFYSYTSLCTIHLRRVVNPGGARLVVEAKSVASTAIMAHVICTFSSLPKEVPDWLISDKVKNL